MEYKKIRGFCRVVSIWDDVLALLIAIVTIVAFIIGGLFEAFLIYPAGQSYIIFSIVWLMGILILIGCMALVLYAGALLWDPLQGLRRRYIQIEVFATILFIILIIFEIILHGLYAFSPVFDGIYMIFLVTGVLLNIIAFALKRREIPDREPESAFPDEMILDELVDDIKMWVQKNEKKIGCVGLTGEYKDFVFQFSEDETIYIGTRTDRCQVIINDRFISRVHCSIRYENSIDRYLITDYSTNGTYKENGERLIRNEQTLFCSDEIFRVSNSHYFKLL